MSFSQSYYRARDLVRGQGFADAIHYAENWQVRVDALYRRLSEVGDWTAAGPGMLPDGRMAVTGHQMSVFEART